MRIPALIKAQIILLGVPLIVATQACHTTSVECRSNADCPGSVCGNGRCLLRDAGGPGDGGADRSMPAPDTGGRPAGEAGGDARDYGRGDGRNEARDAVADAPDEIVDVRHGADEAPGAIADVRNEKTDVPPETADVASREVAEDTRDAAPEAPVDSGVQELTSLELLSQTPSPGGTPIRLVKRDRYVVIGDWTATNPPAYEGGIQIYDVADPARPARMSSLITSGQEVHDLALDGDRLYVADDAAGLLVLDISNPKQPAALNARNDGYYGHSVAVVPKSAAGGPTVLLGNLYQGGLSAYDMATGSLTQPFTYLPSLVAPKADATHIEQITVAGDLAYALVSDGMTQFCLEILRATKPALVQPRKLCLPFSQYGLPGDMRVQGRFLYLATSFNSESQAQSENPGGLRIIDVLDPANPTVVGRLDLPASPHRIPWRGTGLDVDGAHVFQVGHQGVHVIDVSNPSSPRLLRTQAFPSSLGECQGGFALAESNMLYVAAHCPPPKGQGGLLVYRRTP